MDVFRGDPSQLAPAQAPIFHGQVRRRAMVGDAQSKQVTVGLVSFAAGARAVFHVHSFDQVLCITEGEGTVATESEEVTVHPGDLVFIPAGEKHWHGGTPTSAMAHLAIGAPGTTTVVE